MRGEPMEQETGASAPVSLDAEPTVPMLAPEDFAGPAFVGAVRVDRVGGVYAVPLSLADALAAQGFRTVLTRPPDARADA